MAAHYVTGDALSTAWLKTVVTVAAAPDRKMFHTLTCIESPTTEDRQVRCAVDQLMDDLGHPGVETVANTIFPAALAKSSQTPEELGERYRSMYPRLQKLDRANRSGIYFGRIVEYPGAIRNFDQLSTTITKLHAELATHAPKSVRYEINVSDPSDSATTTAPDGVNLHLYAPGKDTSPMGFPCLSFCSLQLDRDKLHMVAHYRSQFLILKGYGNYLGLGRLQAYIAQQAGLTAGQLTIVAGRAHVDTTKARVESLRTLIR